MAKNIYYNLVKQTLENEGRMVTHSSYFLWAGMGRRKVAAGFAAEKFIIAQRDTEKILVEIKSFITASHMNEFHHSVGQYEFYALHTRKTGAGPCTLSGHSASCL